MNICRVGFRSAVGFVLFSISTIALAAWNPQPGWKDSYAVGGVCYCDSSNYDHNLSSKSADTPVGRKNVVQICNDIKNKLGTGPTQGRIPFNDIQCGHGPANDAPDEVGCPGRVDLGTSGCSIKGPRWDLEAVYGTGTVVNEPVPVIVIQPTPTPVIVVQPAPEPVIETPQTPITSASNESCAIVTQSGAPLSVAKQQFVAACVGLKRQDCDPVSGNRWMCSTDNINTSSLVPSTTPQSNPEPSEPVEVVKSVTVPVPVPVNETPQSPITSAGNESCAIVTQSGVSLSVAKQQFLAACVGLIRRDCDPVSGNRWMCSTDNINPSTFVTPTTPQSNPEPSEPVEVAEEVVEVVAEVVEPSVPTNGVCEAQGSNLGAARQAYAASCPNIPRIDCDPTGNQQWTCSSGVIGNTAPKYSTVDVIATPAEPLPATTGSIGRVGANDLVALHYDNCPDRDDGHALAAGKAVVARSGLQNIVVVNGTCGDSLRSVYQPSSEDVARAVWGTQWLDSYNDLDASVQTSAQRWADVLSNGGDVWVAEGGPSDFTANVLRSIASQFPALDLKSVHVVQHSSGDQFNESRTTPSNIELVKREADYVAIPNGNVGGNGSAVFRNNSSFFVETARQSEFSNEWNAAFDYLDPNQRLDFSDTVELLYMINDAATLTVDDFARNYLR